MCGLVGYNGSTAPDISKLKMISLLNENRGTDSCGLFINNKVYYGLDENSRISNFYKNCEFPTSFDSHNFNVLIHNRKSSIGGRHNDNAHPYCFKKTEKSKFFSFVGIHNGTVTNWKALLEEEGIDSTDFRTDSEALLFIIFKNENFKVLSKYEGSAALMFSWTKEKNTLYVFKGGNSEESTEERPLYIVNDGNGLYFSSEKDSLKISSNVKSVEKVPINCVFKFKNGTLVDKFPVTRNFKQVKPNYNYSHYYNYDHYRNYKYGHQTTIGFNQSSSSNSNNNNVLKIDYSSHQKVKEFKDIIGEHIDYKINKKWSFKAMRYFRNGHLYSGRIKGSEIDETFADEVFDMKDGIILKPFSEYNEIIEEWDDALFYRKSKIFKYALPNFDINDKGVITDGNGVFFLNGVSCHSAEDDILKYPGVALEFRIKDLRLSSVSSIKDTSNKEESIQEVDELIDNIITYIDDAAVFISMMPFVNKLSNDDINEIIDMQSEIISKAEDFKNKIKEKILND